MHLTFSSNCHTEGDSCGLCSVLVNPGNTSAIKMLPVHPPQMPHAGTAFVSSRCISQTPFSPSSHPQPAAPVLIFCSVTHSAAMPVVPTAENHWTPMASHTQHGFARTMLLTGLNSGRITNYRKTKHVSGTPVPLHLGLPACPLRLRDCIHRQPPANLQLNNPQQQPGETAVLLSCLLQYAILI